MSARWPAYDSCVDDASNTELEPGNVRGCSGEWSELREAEWSWSAGCSDDAASSTAEEEKQSDHARQASLSSRLPARTLTTRSDSAAGSAESAAAGAAHSATVCFLPCAFLPLQPPAEHTAAVAAVLTHLKSLAPFLSGYSLFRLIWILAREGVVPPQRSTDAEWWSAAGNVYAPVITHDPRATMRRIITRLGLDVEPEPFAPSAAVPSAAAAAAAASTPLLSSAARAHVHAGILPETPFASAHDNPDSMSIEVLRVLVHAHAAASSGSLDARRWTATDAANYSSAFPASCAAVQSALSSHFESRLSFYDFVRRVVGETLPPPIVLKVLQRGCGGKTGRTVARASEWTDPAAQEFLVHSLLPPAAAASAASAPSAADNVALYPPGLEYQHTLWKTLCASIESQGCIEVHSLILGQVEELTRRRAQGQREGEEKAHWTASYHAHDGALPQDGHEDEGGSSGSAPSASSSAPTPTAVLHAVTLAMESAFSSTTGCSLWPAGMSMSEFILDNAAVFRGRRVLELGCGIGLTAIMLQRVGASCVICTDCDDKALRNLRENLQINSIPLASYSDSTDGPDDSTSPLAPGVHVAPLDWLSPTRQSALRRAAADIVLACDTIYLPDLHDAHGGVVQEALAMATAAAAAAASSASLSAVAASSSDFRPCAYFAQMNRNPETFAHFLSTFSGLGLDTGASMDLSGVRRRFEYDREAIQFHQFHLRQ